MLELGIFIDESGDFGDNSSFYLLTFVFHDKSKSIASQLEGLSSSLEPHRFPSDGALHTGPMVRKEDAYRNMGLSERRQLFDKLLTFTRTCDISYKTFCIRKKEYPDRLRLKQRLAREVSLFLRDNMGYFADCGHVIAYYDNGQAEITDLVNTTFGAAFFDVEFRKAMPNEHRLSQSADLLCTLELLRVKDELSIPMTKSEEVFFESRRRLRKDYLKTIDKLRFENRR